MKGVCWLVLFACNREEPKAPTIVIPSPRQPLEVVSKLPPKEAAQEVEVVDMPFELRSEAFANATLIPKKYTGDGADVSPPLAWKNLPAGTTVLALVMDDPDAPMGVWDHWIVYDLPKETTSLAEGLGKTAKLPAGAKEGKNSWGRANYGGPSPPPGKPHRYYFKLYALSQATGLAAGASKTDLESAMQGKILGVAQWMGTYGR